MFFKPQCTYHTFFRFQSRCPEGQRSKNCGPLVLDVPNPSLWPAPCSHHVHFFRASSYDVSSSGIHGQHVRIRMSCNREKTLGSIRLQPIGYSATVNPNPSRTITACSLSQPRAESAPHPDWPILLMDKFKCYPFGLYSMQQI